MSETEIGKNARNVGTDSNVHMMNLRTAYSRDANTYLRYSSNSNNNCIESLKYKHTVQITDKYTVDWRVYYIRVNERRDLYESLNKRNVYRCTDGREKDKGEDLSTLHRVRNMQSSFERAYQNRQQSEKKET